MFPFKGGFLYLWSEAIASQAPLDKFKFSIQEGERFNIHYPNVSELFTEHLYRQYIVPFSVCAWPVLPYFGCMYFIFCFYAGFFRLSQTPFI